MLTGRVNDAALMQVLDQVQQRLDNTAPMMNAIAGVMLEEVKENFVQQGRPKWKDLYPSTKKARARRGTWPGNILDDSGDLLDNISSSSDARHAAVGTNIVYAAIQNFGGTIIQPPRKMQLQDRYKKSNQKTGKRKGQFKKGKKAGGEVASGQRVIDIPARPFMTLPDSGVKKVIEVAQRYLGGQAI